MSEQLRHKMTSYEVAPPATAWEAIAARLAGDDQHAVLSAKMNGYEPAPPATAWDLIAARINNNDPDAALSEKMHNYEVLPPAHTWNHIAATLDRTPKEKTPVIPFRRLMYAAAAAAVVAVLVIGAWQWLKKTAPATELVQNNPPPLHPGSNPPDKQAPLPATDKHTVQPIPPALVINEHPLKQPVKEKPSMAAPPAEAPAAAMRYAAVNVLPSHPQTAAVTAPPILDANGNPVADIDVLMANSNYLVVTGPNGQLTRISSKFGSLIRYLNGSSGDTEEYLDRVIKESSIWKKRFQEWRNKISQSAYLPAAVNFLDIVELKELVQEK